jgi:hypothetical protein
VSDLIAFAGLGFRHIVDPGSTDHLLFLVALAAIYRGAEWRAALPVVTAFTVGHSLTLAVAVSGSAPLPTSLIEFLIPVTILLTGAENIVGGARMPGSGLRRYRPVLASLFGLVHGAGFANYLSGVFAGPVAVPLLGFNLGIELGQVLVLAGLAVALVAVDAIVGPRRRTVLLSAATGTAAAAMAAGRLPW